MSDYKFEQFCKKHLGNKETYSRDFVELVLKLAWDEAKGVGVQEKKDQEWSEQHPEI